MTNHRNLFNNNFMQMEVFISNVNMTIGQYFKKETKIWAFKFF